MKIKITISTKEVTCVREGRMVLNNPKYGSNLAFFTLIYGAVGEARSQSPDTPGFIDIVLQIDAKKQEYSFYEKANWDVYENDIIELCKGYLSGYFTLMESSCQHFVFRLPISGEKICKYCGKDMD